MRNTTKNIHYFRLPVLCGVNKSTTYDIKKIRSKNMLSLLIYVQFSMNNVLSTFFSLVIHNFHIFHICRHKHRSEHITHTHTRIKSEYFPSFVSIILRYHHENYEHVFIPPSSCCCRREDDWKSMARTRLRKFEEELQAAIEGGMNTYSGHTTWSFSNAVLYCLDISTTIGKPNIAAHLV